MKQDSEDVRVRVLALIDEQFESDAAFERAASLPPKTVSNWRRKRSASYLKQLGRIAPLLGVHAADFLLDAAEGGEETLLHMWRRTSVLSKEERDNLASTLVEVIRLYLSAHKTKKS